MKEPSSRSKPEPRKPGIHTGRLKGNLRYNLGSTFSTSAKRAREEAIEIELRLELSRRARGIFITGPRSPNLRSLDG